MEGTLIKDEREPLETLDGCPGANVTLTV